jgi:hypothetical protein
LPCQQVGAAGLFLLETRRGKLGQLRIKPFLVGPCNKPRGKICVVEIKNGLEPIDFIVVVSVNQKAGVDAA